MLPIDLFNSAHFNIAHRFLTLHILFFYSNMTIKPETMSNFQAFLFSNNVHHNYLSLLAHYPTYFK